MCCSLAYKTVPAGFKPLSAKKGDTSNFTYPSSVGRDRETWIPDPNVWQCAAATSPCRKDGRAAPKDAAFPILSLTPVDSRATPSCEVARSAKHTMAAHRPQPSGVIGAKDLTIANLQLVRLICFPTSLFNRSKIEDINLLFVLMN